MPGSVLNGTCRGALRATEQDHARGLAHITIPGSTLRICLHLQDRSKLFWNFNLHGEFILFQRDSMPKAIAAFSLNLILRSKRAVSADRQGSIRREHRERTESVPRKPSALFTNQQ
jgi:hypothetical protein